MISEDVIAVLKSSSCSSIAELKMKLAISVPYFPAFDKMPPFIISALLNKLMHTSWTKLHQTALRQQFENVISNLCLLMQSGCINMSKLDVKGFTQWLSNSSVRYMCSGKCDLFLHLLDKQCE